MQAARCCGSLGEVTDTDCCPEASVTEIALQNVAKIPLLCIPVITSAVAAAALANNEAYGFV